MLDLVKSTVLKVGLYSFVMNIYVTHSHFFRSKKNKHFKWVSRRLLCLTKDVLWFNSYIMTGRGCAFLYNTDVYSPRRKVITDISFGFSFFFLHCSCLTIFSTCYAMFSFLFYYFPAHWITYVQSISLFNCLIVYIWIFKGFQDIDQNLNHTVCIIILKKW